MDYKEALFKIVSDVFERSENQNWEGLVETIYDILEGLDDQKSVVEFVAKTIDDFAELEPTSEVLEFAIEILKKTALKSVGVLKKAEESETPHGAGGEG